MPRKCRIMLEQRRALRVWVRSQQSKPSQKDCIEWFKATYNRKLHQSTISESLSSRFESLDDQSHEPLSRSRLQLGQWPELEQALAVWRKRVEDGGQYVNSNALRTQARKIWYQLPQYCHQPCPNFSIGWVQRFKRRHPASLPMETHQSSGEPVETMGAPAGSSMGNEFGGAAVQDVYEMRGTVLYWQLMPSLQCLTQSQLEVNPNRVFVFLCGNTVGTDRLPVWIIGDSKSPSALRNMSFPTMGAVWRHNKRAQLSISIMSEWLRGFYEHIGTARDIRLVLDDLPINHSALLLSAPPPNIQICWRPPTSHAQDQDLNKGVIRSFKAYYRRQWLLYALQCLSQGQDPSFLVSLRLMVRWIVRSWNHDITNYTFHDAFLSSLPDNTSLSPPASDIPLDLEDIHDEVIRAAKICDPMSMSEYIEPKVELVAFGEQVVCSGDFLEDFLSDDVEGPELEGSHDISGPLGPLRPTIQDARSALAVVVEYIEGCSFVQSAHLRAVELVERELEALEQCGLGYSD